MRRRYHDKPVNLNEDDFDPTLIDEEESEG